MDPSWLVLQSGEPVKRLLAECVPGAINGSLPGWQWRPVDSQTGLGEGELLPWNTTIPPCSMYHCITVSTASLLLYARYL